jgi:hypothetical protein
MSPSTVYLVSSSFWPSLNLFSSHSNSDSVALPMDVPETVVTEEPGGKVRSNGKTIRYKKVTRNYNEYSCL